MRLLLCILLVITLASCKNQTVAPEYPLDIFSVVTVENEILEYTADFRYNDGASVFVINKPSMLNGMKITVSDDVSVSYNDINLTYDSFAKFGFTTFKDLHNVILLLNEQKPEFSNGGELLLCEVDYKGKTVKITADSKNFDVEKIIINNTTYYFD